VSEAALLASGPEREIFLRALRRMSDECVSPELLAECPFSIEVPDQPGVRGCGEECLELLKKHGSPPSASAIPLGSSGIAARPFRKRRRPSTSNSSSGERAFDAAEWYFRDAGRPRRLWKSVSLFYEFGERLISPPMAGSGEQRLNDLTACAAELQRRDFDVDHLVDMH
jgi:hypothetical protein